MKHILLIAGAAALGFAAPAYAKPGKGHGNAAHSHGAHGKGSPHGYGAGGCPPGLAKKSPACVPPGQAKQPFNIGQRVPSGYNGFTAYNQIPNDVRQQYGLSDDYRYIYRDDYLYRVDPKTMLVQQVLSAILR